MMGEGSRLATRCRSSVAGTAIAAGLLLLTTPAAAFQWNAEEAALLERAAASRAKGNADAPVLVYEIADFQCPYCARFARTVFPHIDSAYVRAGKVQWVFVNLPLPSHARSWGAAKAALCAGGVGGEFWAVRDLLFANQREWATAHDPIEVFSRYAGQAGIPGESFRDCLVADRVAPLLLEDVLFAAATARVSGTPTFIIHPDQKVIGLKSVEEWRTLLDGALDQERRGR